MEKSLRIRVCLDVRKPLRKNISIKIRGGDICDCPVRYEKLPLICYFCGRLGHGTNDCKEVFGERSPVKLYGPWMKASPWKPMTTEDSTVNMGVHGTCGRKLYFSKKVSHQESVEGHQHSVHNVTTLLNNVVITDGGVDDHPSLSLGNITRQEVPTTNMKVLDDVEHTEVVEVGQGIRDIVIVSSLVQHPLVCKDGIQALEHDRELVVSSGKGQKSSLTAKRVKKWKKLDRVMESKGSSIRFLPSVGEKRAGGDESFDPTMSEAEERTSLKRRYVPMEVEILQHREDDNVASPTSWALGSQ
ncbi:unnamed protein product [Amaranthus hypochondriacus]